MARILVYTTPAEGHLVPLVPILDDLHRRGHQIVLRTLGSQVLLMRERAFEVAAVSKQIEEIEHDDWRAANPRAALACSVGVFCARAEYDAPDLQQAIATERPDAVIVDINSWGGLSAAEAWGGPWATSLSSALALARCATVWPRSSSRARVTGAHARSPAAPTRAGDHREDHDACSQRYPQRDGASTAQRAGRPVSPSATPPIYDRRALRVSPTRLARKRGHGGPMRVGSSC
jgi:UDP:flavonoid glycosyltransferase YjiC (YdhE family)